MITLHTPKAAAVMDQLKGAALTAADPQAHMEVSYQIIGSEFADFCAF